MELKYIGAYNWNIIDIISSSHVETKFVILILHSKIVFFSITNSY